MTSTEPKNHPNAERLLIQFRVQTALRVAHANKLIPPEYHASYLDDCKFVDQIFSKFRDIRKQSNKKDNLFKMVQLVEVEDEHFQGAQQAQAEDEGDFTDTGTQLPKIIPSVRPSGPSAQCKLLRSWAFRASLTVSSLDTTC